jgi:topoisomerase-4 subunit A
MQDYDLSDIPSQCHLRYSSASVGKVREIELRREQDELATERAILQEYLDNPDSLTGLLIDELKMKVIR